MTKEQAIKLLRKDTSPMEIHILTIEGLKQSEITDKIQEAMDMGIEAIKNQTWISVKDRLPEEGSYLVTRKYICRDETYIDLLEFSNDLYKLDKYDFQQYKGKQKKGFYEFNSEFGFYEIDEVIAWMPLPKPYIQSEADD